MNRLARTAAPLAAIVAVLATTGCFYKGGSEPIRDLGVPPVGENLPAKAWETAATDKAKSGESQFLWLLPITGTYTGLEFNRDATSAEYNSVRWFDLGPLMVTLPVYISMENRWFHKDAAAPPPSRSRITWTPFWAWTSRENHAEGGRDASASGIPLLWSRVSLKAVRMEPGVNVDHRTLSEEKRAAKPSMTTEIHGATHLWSLGPAWANVDTKIDTGVEAGFWFFTPVFAAGSPGMILWTSWGMNAGESKAYGHGPLFGALGLLRAEGQNMVPARDGGRPESRYSSSTRLVTGLLWLSARHQDAARTKTLDSRNGPLFAAFGWGRKAGVPTVRFLWFNIPVGSAPEPEPAKSEPEKVTG